MIDRTQLTEAHDLLNRTWGHHNNVIDQAIRLLLDFPTDEQVEAATLALSEVLLIPDPLNPEATVIVDAVRTALEGVRDTMIGDG